MPTELLEELDSRQLDSHGAAGVKLAGSTEPIPMELLEELEI